MSTKPAVFVSAVSRELHSARELVAKTLRFLGFDPIFQEEFGSTTGVVHGMLDAKLAPCAAVIQLVGHCYGWDLYNASDPSESMSYTHYEARYAHRNKLPIWYLIISETYPVDTANDEDSQKKLLQSAYRIRVQRTDHIYYAITDAKDVELTVFKMLKELDGLRPAATRWFGGLADDATEAAQGGTAPPAPGLNKAELEQMMRGLLKEFVPALQQTRQTGDADNESRRKEALYGRLGAVLDLPASQAREKIEALAKRLRQDEKESLLDRAKAAYALKDYKQAESLALQGANAAGGSSPPNRELIITALEQAGRAAGEQFHYARALEHYRAAAAFTNRKRAPVEWAHVQWGIALMLLRQGNNLQAADFFRPVFETYQRILGAEHPDTLTSRNNLAVALTAQGRYAEAEKEHRAVWTIRERVLGPEHPDTLQSHSNLANVLNGQGKHAAAEKEQRTVLAACERVLGPEHPDTLQCRNNLAYELDAQGFHSEAGKEFRAVRSIMERVLGPEHPATLHVRNNLGEALNGEKKYVEAEEEHCAVLALRQRLLNPEHPDIFESYLNLAVSLKGQGKNPEALISAKRAWEGRRRALGKAHPDTKQANALLEEIKKAQ